MESWKGRRILAKEDAHELDRAAALREFRDKTPRQEAEEQAYRDYAQRKSVEGAAYHLAGAKAAKAVGNTQDASKHLLAYGLHVKQLGAEPVGPIPEQVAELVDKQAAIYRFKPHSSDGLFAEPEKK